MARNAGRGARKTECHQTMRDNRSDRSWPRRWCWRRSCSSFRWPSLSPAGPRRRAARLDRPGNGRTRRLDHAAIPRPAVSRQADPLLLGAGRLALGCSARAKRRCGCPGLMFGLLGAVTTGLLGWRMFDRTIGLDRRHPLCHHDPAHRAGASGLARRGPDPVDQSRLLLLWEAERVVARRATIACTVRGRAVPGAGHPHQGTVRRGRGRSGLRRLSRSSATGPPCGLCCAASRSWSIAVAGRGAVVCRGRHADPGYLRYFFLERHVLGFATDSQPHGDEPWWYYLPMLLGGGLPWIGYLPIVVRDGSCSRHAPRAGGGRRTECACHIAACLLWTWLIGWTLLMMVAGSKLATYSGRCFRRWPCWRPRPGRPDRRYAERRRPDDPSREPSSARRGPGRSCCRRRCWRFNGRSAFGLRGRLGGRGRGGRTVAACRCFPGVPADGKRVSSAAAISLAVQFVVVMAMVVPPVAEVFPPANWPPISTAWAHLAAATAGGRRANRLAGVLPRSAASRRDQAGSSFSSCRQLACRRSNRATWSPCRCENSRGSRRLTISTTAHASLSVPTTCIT